MTIPPTAEIQRIVYLGTPAAAVPPLRALCGAGYEIGLVVSRPDTRRGRGGTLQPSPVKAAALDLGLDVSDDLEDLAGVSADLGVVVAFGEIIPPALLEQLSMVNIHFSLLPRWRGAAPVERAILAGDEVTGVSLMAVDDGLDTGAIYRRAEISIDSDEESGALRARLIKLGTEVLIEALAEGLGEPEPQIGEPVYARKITAEDRHIDWTQPAVQIHRQVRVGGAWTTFRDQQFKIWRTAVDDSPVAPDADRQRAGLPGAISGLSVATGEGRIDLLEVQAQGRTRQVAFAWHNGVRLTPEDRFV
ncbi:MAG: methionyl-tRNA formyltransferase [Acidimicrobiaceae bacterium]|nr:methionyl-tRNA formyltransferase [Acidimicrobiaceae bacterium]